MVLWNRVTPLGSTWLSAYPLLQIATTAIPGFASCSVCALSEETNHNDSKIRTQLQGGTHNSHGNLAVCPMPRVFCPLVEIK